MGFPVDSLPYFASPTLVRETVIILFQKVETVNNRNTESPFYELGGSGDVRVDESCHRPCSINELFTFDNSNNKSEKVGLDIRQVCGIVFDPISSGSNLLIMEIGVRKEVVSLVRDPSLK